MALLWGGAAIATEFVCPKCGGTAWQQRDDGTWQCSTNPEVQRVGTLGITTQPGHG